MKTDPIFINLILAISTSVCDSFQCYRIMYDKKHTLFDLILL